MKGTHNLVVQSAHLKYEMSFCRNLTVIQGDSATGKTTLVDMIQEYLLNGTDTGIMMSCDCPCRVIAGSTWQEQLQNIENSIVFVDEGNRFVASEDFARAVNGSSNYFVIVTREALSNLPYSVTEIYGIRSSGRFGFLEPVYHQMYRIYGDDERNVLTSSHEGNHSQIVVEDSNAGYEFFSGIASDGNEVCTAGGATSIFNVLQDVEPFVDVTVIADGAAFGSQIGRIFQLMQRRTGIRLYLPESFEWIILSADILNDVDIRTILSNPSDYIDSAEYVSWERYFTQLLTGKSNGTWMQYSKKTLNPAYLQGKTKDRILAVLPDSIRTLFE